MSNPRLETPRLSMRCRDTACRATLRADLASPGSASLDCPACGKTHALRIDDALARDGLVAKCAVCDGTEFFIRKDFPQRLGMALVVLFGLVASIFYYYRNIPATFGTLAALVVVDAAIYFFVGIVTVCYRCRAEYRGLPRDPRYGGFDLATSEKYDPAS
jgi:hypothetical protein